MKFALAPRWAIAVCTFSLLCACGGGTEPAKDAGDANSEDGDSEDGASEDGASEDGASKDGSSEDGGGTDNGGKIQPGGIVRDADGDGISDDKEKSPCESKNETQCKINMECAWSEEGKCVKAKAGM